MTSLSANVQYEVENELWRINLWKYAHEVSGKKWQAWAFLQYIAKKIERAIKKGSGRLLVNLPPRHGKSELISKWTPCWFLDLFPERRVILTSYGDDLAKDYGRAVRNELAENPLTWARPRTDASSVASWLTEAGGWMRTSGVGGPITGRGGDLLIIDDPHKNWEEAVSPRHRRRIIDWFNSTFYTRAEPRATIIVVQTRWHENDLTGYLMNDHNDSWELIRLPGLAEENDILKRKVGEALCPSRFDTTTLEAIRKGIGSHMFAGLYQQRPSPIEGGVVKRDWFRRFSEMPESFDQMIQSWDLSFKETGTSYVVGEVWGRKDANLFLVDLFRDKIDFPETCRQMIVLTNRWPKAVDKLVEDKANGPALIATLRDRVPGIIAYSPKGNKESRLVAVSGYIESGNVFIPDSSLADWADDFIEEVTTFPNASNDDQVDAMTQALDRLAMRKIDFNFTIPSVGVRSNPWEDIHAQPH